MVGGLTGVPSDIAPYCFAFGSRAQLVGLNMIGLRRRGLDKAQLHQIRAAYRFIFTGPGVFADRVQAARAEYGASP